MRGRADIEGSKSNVAMNAWLPQASYPCGGDRAGSTFMLAPSRASSYPEAPAGVAGHGLHASYYSDLIDSVLISLSVIRWLLSGKVTLLTPHAFFCGRSSHSNFCRFCFRFLLLTRALREKRKIKRQKLALHALRPTDTNFCRFYFRFFATYPSPARKTKKKAAEVSPAFQRRSFKSAPVFKNLGFKANAQWPCFCASPSGLGAITAENGPRLERGSFRDFFFFDTSSVLAPFF